MNKGLKLWKEHGESAMLEEVKQLYFCDTFKPIDSTTLTKEEFNQVLESHLFLKEKHDGTIKG